MEERWFSFRGQRQDLFGLELAELPVRPIAAETGESIAVPGRDGEVWIPRGGAEGFRIRLECRAAGPIDRGALARWLYGGEGRLVFSDDPDHAYIARVEGGIAVGNGRAEIRFLCGPWRYLEPPAPDAVLRAPGSVWNGGDVTEPRITVAATGDLSMTVNGTRIDVTAPEGGGESGLVLDTMTADCLEADGETFAGGRVVMEEFPVLKHGSNEVTWTGDVREVRIERRIRER